MVPWREGPIEGERRREGKQSRQQVGVDVDCFIVDVGQRVEAPQERGRGRPVARMDVVVVLQPARQRIPVDCRTPALLLQHFYCCLCLCLCLCFCLLLRCLCLLPPVDGGGSSSGDCSALQKRHFLFLFVCFAGPALLLLLTTCFFLESWVSTTNSQQPAASSPEERAVKPSHHSFVDLCLSQHLFLNGLLYQHVKVCKQCKLAARMRSWRERVAGKQAKTQRRGRGRGRAGRPKAATRAASVARLFTAGWFECSRLVFFLHLVRAMEGPRSSNSSPSSSRLRPLVVDPLDQAGFVSRGDTV